MMRFAFVLLCIPAAYGQDLERVFRLTETPDQRGQQEIATTLRTVGRITNLSVDPAAATLTIHAPAAQVALAEWLVPQLEHPPSGPQRYKVSGSPDDIAMVYPLVNIRDSRGIQEVITNVRTVLSVQLIYFISSTHMLALRANASEMATVEFLLPELDRAPQPRQAPGISHFPVPQPLRGFDTVTAYHLVHATSAVAIQEIVTTLRSAAEIMKIYSVYSNATLSICASQSDTQVAEWLIGRLDRAGADTETNQLRAPGGKDDVIRVFYLAHVSGGSQIKQLANSVRAETKINKLLWVGSPAAVVVRGTADAVEAAARVVERVNSGRDEAAPVHSYRTGCALWRACSA